MENVNMNLMIEMKTKTIRVLDTGQRNETTATVIEDKKEINRIRVKEWRKNNPDKYKEHLKYVKQWKFENNDKVRKYNLDNYHKHKEERKEYNRNRQRLYRQNNREHINKLSRERRRKKRLGQANKSGRKTTN
jgi:hypothetical protein